MASSSDLKVHRTPAQWYCVLFGAVLLLVGLLGFAADGSFDTGSDIQGDTLFGFEVNGWHNLVHIASGLLLLAAANYRPTAKTVTLVFGATYAFVTLWGLVDGDEVFNLLPVNPADNILHALLAVTAIAAGVVSPTTKRQQVNHKRDKQAHKREKQDDRDRKAYVGGVDAPVAGGTVSGRTKTPLGSGHGSEQPPQ